MRNRWRLILHELSVAREIIEIVREEMTRLKLKKVEVINLRVGALTELNHDSLLFGFEASVANTPLDGAKLVIESVPIKGHCRSCTKEFEVEEFVFICPHCGSSDLKVLEGEELDIDHLVGI